MLSRACGSWPAKKGTHGCWFRNLDWLVSKVGLVLSHCCWPIFNPSWLTKFPFSWQILMWEASNFKNLLLMKLHEIPHMGVSWNRDTPKSSNFLVGFSMINHPFFGGTPFFGIPHYLQLEIPGIPFLALSQASKAAAQLRLFELRINLIAQRTLPWSTAAAQSEWEFAAKKVVFYSMGILQRPPKPWVSIY